MNDKERLQRLKRLNLSNVWEHLEQTTLYGGNALKESWEWLIEQAEKAVVSEELLDQQRAMNMKIKLKYTKQKQQLQQAQAKLKRYENALQNIIDWGPLGGSYTDLSAASTFQRIAKKALEGKE
jgi:hypothetical protein